MSTRQVHASATKASHVLTIVAIALASVLAGFSIGIFWSGSSPSTVPTQPPSTSNLSVPSNTSNASGPSNTSNASGPAQKAHIYFLLDRSGSMRSIASDVIGGFNTFVQEQKLAASDSAGLTMTLIQFDGNNPHEVVFSAQDISSVPLLTASTFQPRGSTPLNDAIGSSISMAEAAEVPNERIVVVIFSDGQENASRHRSRQDIFRLVHAKQEAGWTFVFLGANQDSYAESSGRGVSGANTQNYAFDSGGVQQAYGSVSSAMLKMRERVSEHKSTRARHGQKQYRNMDFFEGDKSAEMDFKSRAQHVEGTSFTNLR